MVELSKVGLSLTVLFGGRQFLLGLDHRDDLSDEVIGPSWRELEGRRGGSDKDLALLASHDETEFGARCSFDSFGSVQPIDLFLNLVRGLAQGVQFGLAACRLSALADPRFCRKPDERVSERDDNEDGTDRKNDTTDCPRYQALGSRCRTGQISLILTRSTRRLRTEKCATGLVTR